VVCTVKGNGSSQLELYDLLVQPLCPCCSMHIDAVRCC